MEMLSISEHWDKTGWEVEVFPVTGPGRGWFGEVPLWEGGALTFQAGQARWQFRWLHPHDYLLGDEQGGREREEQTRTQQNSHGAE